MFLTSPTTLSTVTRNRGLWGGIRSRLPPPNVGRLPSDRHCAPVGRTVLAPMFSNAWKQGPWLNSVWAYLHELKQANPTVAAQIDAVAESHNISSVGNDVWGSTESHAGTRTTRDSLPPYTAIGVGQVAQVCSAGTPLEYNKESNARMLFVVGDRSHIP